MFLTSELEWHKLHSMITLEVESQWGKFEKCIDCRRQFKKEPYNYLGLPCKVAYQTGFGFIKGPKIGSSTDNQLTCEGYKPNLETIMKKLPNQPLVILRAILVALPR